MEGITYVTPSIIVNKQATEVVPNELIVQCY